MGRTRTPQFSFALFRMYSMISGLSATGFVLGMQAIAVNPPLAAAAEPVSMSSL